MPSADLLLAFAAATLLFAYMPGPALLYTAGQTLARGRRAGFMAALGIHVGCYVHVVAAALGLSTMFSIVPSLYIALKIAGGAYLVYLGIQMIRGQASDGQNLELPRKSGRKAFMDSVLVEVLNPKVAVFFIAFLPQFVSPAASLPIWVQFLVLGTLVNFAFTSADIVAVMFASEIRKRLMRQSRFQYLVRWIGGSVLAALGLKLATDRS